MTGFPETNDLDGAEPEKPLTVFEKLSRFHRARPGHPPTEKSEIEREVEELRLRLPGARSGSRSDERTQVVETEEHPDPRPGADGEPTATVGEDQTATRAISVADDLLGYFLREPVGETTIPTAELRKAIFVLFAAADRIELLETIVGWVFAGYDLEPIEIEYVDEPSEWITPFDDVLAELADALPKTIGRDDALVLRAREVER